MPKTTLIIGGCRSGKSSHALQIGETLSGRRNLFVATCQGHDAEMVERIRRHQETRADHWQTIETPVDIIDVISQSGVQANVMVIDCLTLWISNLMAIHDNDPQIIDHIDRLHDTILKAPCPIIMVTNEVGTGIVPENALARRFRDLAGWCNQKIASGCSEVVLMVAGIATKIK